MFYQHTQGVSQKALSVDLRLGKATIEIWYHHGYFRQSQALNNRMCPQVLLGIDEHFFSKKQGFATTLCDLRKHKVFDVVKGRSGQEIEAYLQALPGKIIAIPGGYITGIRHTFLL